MALFAIAYPNISEPDYDWIQNLRQKHDRQFDLVRPHITLVFGTDKLSPNELTTHVRESLATFRSFSFRFDSARVVEDNSKTFFHAFLIPSNGFDEINELHDLLYRGTLESELRSDIPFTPHLTIGSGTKAGMAALVDLINGQARSINGRIDKVNVIELAAGRIRDLAEVSLL